MFLLYFVFIIVSVAVTFHSVIDHFICKYKNQNKFSGKENWSPYQCKTFIKLAFVVHKNPKMKYVTEHKQIAMLNYAGNVGSDSEIFFSEITTQTELDKIFENPDSGSSNGSNFTLIEGAPGIGKTVVAKEIAYRWAQNKMLFNIKFLLLISFRETDISQITSFKELMLHCYREDEEAASYCAEYFIRTQGKNLMIIFDGYDEMSTEKQEKNDSIFSRLLAKDSVPECHLVVTSRPYITAHLHQLCNCRVEIMGFTNNDRLKYFEENLSPELLKFVTKFLQKHLIIDSLCYIPLNLMSFLKLVEYPNYQNEDSLPKTQTKLTEHTIHLTILHNLARKGKKVSTTTSLQDEEIKRIIISLARFAYKMLNKEKLVFSETELRAEISVTEDEDKCGLLKAVQIDTAENVHVQPKMFYSFVHFSVQEYLAAYHLSTRFKIAQALELDRKFYNYKYFGVWRMYTGLANGDKFPLKKFLSGEFYFTASLRYLLGFGFPGVHKKLKDNKIAYLWVYQMYLEAPESQVKESLKDVVNTDNDTLNLSGEENFSQDDMSMLAHFIARSCITQQWKLIKLSDCNINDERLLTLKHNLCIEDGRIKPIIKCLDISGNCNINKLNTIVKFSIECNLISNLKASNIYKDGKNTEIVADKQDCNNTTLQMLDLSENHLQNDNVRNLCKALVHCKNLERLDLSNNKIEDEAIGFLVKAIVQWDKLQELKIENNAFSDYDESNKLIEFVIAHHLECNSQVTISPNGNVAQESQGQIMALSQGSRISSDSSSYTKETKTLDFIRQTENIKYFIALLGYTNDVRSENSKYIDCISQLHKLSLECIQSEGITLTKNASMFFKDHFKMLEEINLSGLVISEESAEAITFGNKLQCIKLNSCKLSSKAAVLIANRLKIAGSIKEIELCNNSLDDKATEGLVAAFLYCNHLVKFGFAGNKFNKKIELLFDFFLPHLKFSDLSLDLSSSLDNVSSFITLLEYMKEVPIDNKPCYVENISKIIELNLNCLKYQTDTPVRLTVTSSVGFQIFNYIKSLNISGITINEDIANHLMKVFENNSQLEQLFMNKCQITSPTFKIICWPLNFNSKLKVFELSENFVDDEAIEELAIAILHWNFLEHIKIDKKRFSDHGMLLLRLLMKSMEPKSTMYFGKNSDVIKSFIKVLDYASNNTGVRVIKFFNNLFKITRLSMKVQTQLELTVNASDSLKKLRNLVSLNVSGVTITEQVTNNLCDLFNDNIVSLKHLIMNDCGLNSNIVIKFANILKLAVTIIDVQFCDNKIDDNATIPLVIAILHWKTPRAIELENNHFTNDSILIFDMLRNFPKTFIDFNGRIHKIIPFITLLGYMADIDIENSVLVEDVSKTQKLLLDCSELNNTNVQFEVNASKFFTRFVSLTHLNISGIVISKEVADNLAKALDSNLCSLGHLIMNNCQLTSVKVFDIIKRLQNCDKMRELQLCNNFIDDEATGLLVVVMVCCKAFEMLGYTGNHFSKKTELLFEFLLHHLKFSDLFLDLSTSLDNVSSFITLLEYIKEVPTVTVNKSCYLENISKVTKLNLNCLKYQTDTPVRLTVTSSVGFQIFNCLKSLNISGITIHEDIATHLMKVFENNSQLEELFMNKCQITSPTMKLFCQQLKFNSKLKVFKLNENSVDDAAIEELAIAILHWNLLECIKIDKNWFSAHGMLLLRILAQAMEPESTVHFGKDSAVIKTFIKVLDYASNITGVRVTQFFNNLLKITEMSMEVKAQVELTVNASDSLKNLRNLFSLNVSGVTITEQVTNNLCDLFNDNIVSLKHLIMNNCGLNSNIVIKFANKLKLAVTIVDVQFCNNEIDDNATKPLAITILHWKTLRAIELENNYFSNDSILIFDILRNFPNTFIDFNGRIDKIIPFITLLGYMADIDIKNSVLVEDVSKTQKLLLDCSQLSHTNMQFKVNASKFFTRFVSLTHLNISGIGISKEVADNLAKSLDSNLCSLQHLIMNNCQLTSVKVCDIIKRLQNCDKMRELQLCNNFIDDEATELLVVAMVCCKAFEMLGYKKNRFSKKTELLFEFLLSHLKFSNLSLDLSSSLDNVSSFITLLGYRKEVPTDDKSCYLKNISKITELNLNCLNHQTYKPVRLTVTSSVGFQIFICLKSLNISGITINEDIANHLVKVFEKNSQLEQLFMNKCQIASPTMKIFCRQLKFNSKLRVFELSENSVDDEAIEELAIAILHWNLLKRIKIDKKRLNDHGMLLLGILIKAMEPESTVHFGKNSAVIKSFIKVLEYASNNTGVRVTQFFNNVLKITKLSMEVQTQLELTVNASVSLKSLRNLVSLNVSGVTITEQVTNNLCDLFNDNIVSLKHLIMNDCGLNSNIVTKFTNKLKLAVTIVDVQFCNNKIDDYATKSLAITILHWKTLRAIGLENNHFTNSSILIFDTLRNFPNTFIDFNGRIDKIIPFITLLGYMTDIDIKNSVLVEDVSKTQKLLLNCSELNNTNVQFDVIASKFFTKFVSLTHLNISGIVISKEVADNLAKALDSNLCSLEHLIMNNCQLTSDNSINIIKQLRKCVKMKELHLSKNSIDDKATEELVVSILNLNALEILRLEKNCFSKKHEKVFYFLTNNLKFSDSKIELCNDIDSVMSFLTLLEYMTIISVNVSQFVDNIAKVESLNLDSNQNTKYEELELTCKASQFFQRFQLKCLNLSGIHVTGAVVDNICKAFGADLQYLEYLLMNNCKLKSETVIALMQRLQNAKHLKQIELCDNDIDDAATEALAIAILHWNLLESFKLEKNNFTKNSTELFEILKGFLRVCNICIDFNGRIDKIVPFITLLRYMADINIKNSIVVEDVSKTQKLLLDCSQLSHTNVQFKVNASKFFTRFVSLTHLNISGIGISKEVADNLAKSLDSNLCSLEYLIMNNCQLTSVKVCDIIKRLQNCDKMRELQLCNNFIDDEATELLVVAMVCCKAFEMLGYKKNRFSKKTELLFEFLLFHLKFSNLSLDLSSSLDNVSSFITLLGYRKEVPTDDKSCYLKNISKITELNLNCLNHQTYRPVRLTVTSSVGFQIFICLKSLNISGITINEDIANHLVKVFENNSQLEQLFMNKCQIASPTMKIFCRQLKFNSKLRVFELSENSVDDEAIEELAIAILHWNLLKRIKIDKNWFSDHGTLLLEMLTKDIKPESAVHFGKHSAVIKSFIKALEYTSNNTGERVAQFFNNLFKITKLSMEVQTQLELTVNASVSLKNLRNLVSLNVSGVTTTEQVTINLCDLFNDNIISLKHLIMNDCGLNSSIVIKFANKLKLAVTIIDVQFCNNKIDDNATKPLAIAILHWKTLRAIELGNNHFTNDSILIFDMLRNFPKTFIDFNGRIHKIIPFITLLGYMADIDIKDSVLVEDVSKTQKLLLDCSELNNTNVQFEVNASKFFTRFVSLTHLNISGIVISKEVADNLAIAFDSNLCSLEHLIMNNCQLTSDNSINIIKTLRKCVKIRELQLSNNLIDNVATEELVVSILHLNEVELLSLENNCFGDTHQKVFDFLANNLKFSECEIDFSGDVDGIIAFIILLEYMSMVPVNVSDFVHNISKIKNLSLDCSKQSTTQRRFEITPKASEFLRRFKFAKLDFSGIYIAEEVINNLCEAFGADLTSLEFLFMNNCNLRSTSVIKLMKTLQNAKHIKEIELCNNEIDDEAMDSLVIAILHCNLLERVTIEHNNFTEDNTKVFEILNEIFIFCDIIIDFNGRTDKIIPFITLLGYMVDIDIDKSVLIENVTKIKKLILNCSEQSSNTVQFEVNASKFFTRFVSLTHLNISRIAISEEVADNLAKALDSNLCSLEHLIMNKCQLTSVNSINILKNLRKCVNMKELHLSNNLLDDKGAEDLVVSILYLNALETLRLKENRFSTNHERVFHYISNNLQFSDSEIDFSDDIDSVISFLTLLEYMTIISVNVSQFVDNISKVKNLKLNCLRQNIRYKEFKLTYKSSQFFQRFQLININISGIHVTGAVVDNICGAFGADLQYLFMNNCKLKSETVIVLMQSLRNAKHLKEIELCDNDIDDAATETLAIAILHWNLLESIKLEKNNFTENSTELFEILKGFLRVSDTCIDFNGRTDKIILFITLLGYMADIDIKNSILVEDFSKTQKLLLDCSELNNTNVRFEVNASKFFTRFVSLTHLNISGIAISKEVADNLAKALDSNLCSLEHLIMNNCQLTSVNGINILKKLRKCVNMKELHLSNNLLDDKSAEDLVVSILYLNALETLRLKENRFSTNHERVFHYISNNLQFSDSEIDCSDDIDSVILFLTLLEYMTIISVNVSQFVDNISKVKNLNLDCLRQNIRYKELKLTYKSSQFFHRFQLTNINVSGIHVTGAVVDNICKGFGADLQYLFMNNCKLKSETVIVLMQSLRNAKHLKEIELCDNDIDDAATEALAIAILHWNLLESIKLEKNNFTENSRELFEVLKGFLRVSDTCIDFNGRIDKIIPFITLLGYMVDIDIKNSVLVEDFSKIQKLLLDCSELNNTSVQFEVNASKFFTRFVSLTHLNISGIAISKEVADNLAKALDSNLCSLEHLIMNNCQLTSVKIFDIIKRLQNCDKMRELQLCNNFIDNETTEVLVVAMVCCKAFEMLGYTGNHFSKKTELLFEFLLPHLMFSDLSLDLSSSLDNVSSFITLLEYMKKVPTNKSCYLKNISKITELNLNCLNHQTDTPVRLTVTSSVGFQIFNCLKSLNISGITINEDIANHLLKVFENNSQLEELFMNKCQIASPTMKIICQQLKFDSKLKVFELSENSVDDEAIEELAIAMFHWNLLECIKIDKNMLSDHGTLLLEMLTKDMKPESAVHFGEKSSVIKSFIKVLDYASNNTSVRVAQFFNNLFKTTKMSMEVKMQLELTVNASVSLKNLRNLVSLNASGVTITEQVTNNLCELFNDNIISLKHLIMNDCGLNSNTVSKFADKLKLAVTIVDVQFCNNKIDDNATKSLVIAILYWKTLRAIDLENNYFSNDSILIFDILKNFPNTFIDFNDRIDKIIPFITLLGYMADIDIKNSVLVEDVSKTQKLLLDCSELKHINVQFEVNASKFFTRFVSLTHLNISGIAISKEVADNLAKALDSNLCSLEQLIMNNCQLTSKNSINIIKNLCKCVKMRELQLSNNSIDDEATEDLIVSILHLNTLEILRLEENHFSKKHEKAFYFLTNNLKFSDSKIDFYDDIGTISFLTLLEYMTIISVNVSQFVDNISKVESLNLDCSNKNTKFEELELTCKASQFFQRFKLKCLNLSGIHVTGAVVDSICKGFGADLGYLFMNKCKLKSETVIVFMQSLRNAKHLKEIELCDNDIDDEATEALAIAILQWNLLESMKLEKNNFTENSIELFEILKGPLRVCNTFIDFNGRIDKIIPFITLLGYMADIDIKNSVLVEDVSKTQKLLLDCSELSHTNVQFKVNASKFFTRFVSLTHLNISGIGISKEVADNLAKSLDSNLCSLQHLIMNNCQLTSVKVCDIIKRLQNCDKMRELQLCNNFIDDEATELLVVAMVCCKAFEMLGYKKNRFSKKTELLFEFLLHHLTFSDLTVDLSSNLDNVSSFITLFEYMKKVPTNKSCYVDNISKITELNLNCLNHQTDTPVRLTVTSSVGFQIFNCLKSLNISGITINEDIANDLAKVFKNNSQLEQLFMNKCQITSPTMKIFCWQLKFNSKLKVIELDDNFVDDEAIEELAIAILHWNLLKYTKIDKNKLSDHGMLLLGMLMKSMEPKSTVHFGKNAAVIKSFIKILDYASNNSDVRVTQLFNNLYKITKMSMEVQTQLELTVNASVSLKNLRNLITLNVSGVTITEQVTNNLCDLFNNNIISLKHLIMNDCGLNSNTVLKFADTLKLAVTIINVQFCNNKIDDNATKSLVIAILHWKTLRAIKLENNHFTNSSILIFDVLRNFPNTFIDFSGRIDKIIPFITLLGYMADIDIKDSVLVEDVSKTQKLLLDCSELNNTNVQFEVNASKFFTRFVSLTHLNISGIVISKEVADNLAKALDTNLCSLEHLIMNNCQLTSDNSTNIIKKVCKCVKMKELQLSNNLIDNVAAEELVVSILHLNEVELLALENNCFNNTHQKVFHFLVNNLKFSECEIDFSGDVDGIIAFIILLECMTMVPVNESDFVHNISKIKNLSLDCSKQSSTHRRVEMTPRASEFLRRFKFTKLNLSGIYITEEVINNLCEAFGADLTSLEYLLMNNCNLRSTSVIKLMKTLKNAKHIKEIELCNNEIDDEAMDSLVIAILHCNLLERVTIEHNNFTEDNTKVFETLNEILIFCDIIIDFNGRTDKIIPFITLLGYMVDIDIDKSVLIENVTKIKKLILNCSEQSSNIVQFEVNASKFFTRFISLTHLNISRIAISEEVADNLAKALDSNLCSLEHLIMNKCQLTSVNSINILKKLRKCVNMKELHLSNNLIDDKGAEDLVVSILYLNELETLRLKENRFSTSHERVFHYISNNLQFSDSEIDFSDDIDSVISFLTLLEYMTIISVNVSQFVDNITKVESLNLDCSNQNTKYEELELTFKASKFFQRFRLKCLNLSGIHVTGAVVDSICKAFGADLQYLEYFFMNKCKLKSEMVIVLMQSLRNAKHLKEIELCDNDIDDAAIEALAIAILHWNLLESFKLEENHFTENSRELFAIIELLLIYRHTYKDIVFNGVMDIIIPFITLLGYMADIANKNSILVEYVSKTQKLLLDCSELNNTNVQFKVNASKFFTRFVNLTHLNISGIAISKEVADNLAKALDSNLCSLEHLIMNNCQLTSMNSINIIKKLRKCVKIRELQLSNNLIDNVATKELFVSILYLNKVEFLALKNNCFDDIHQKVFYLLVNNLKFSECEMDFSGDVDGIIAFIILLEYMAMVSVNESDFVHNISKIKKLNLDCSKQSTTHRQLEITPRASEFFRTLKLTKLNLSGIHITEEVINNLCESFGTDLTSLEFLLMNNCNLRSTSVIKLMKTLQNAKHIKEIELCNNEIDDEAMDSLVEAFLHCNFLEPIKLEDNRFSKAAIMLLKILRFTEDIESGTVVDFRSNDIVVKSFIKVLDYTNINQSKRVTQFLNNLSLTNELFMQVDNPLELTLNASNTLKNLRNLIALNISGIIITEQVANNLCYLYDNNQKSFKHLIMNSCGLNSNMISKFTHKLKLATSMVDIQICENKIDDAATKSLATSILHWNVLNGFQLENNYFTDSSIRLFDTLYELLKFGDTIIDFNGRRDKIISFITLLGYMADVDIDKSVLIENVTKIKKLTLNCSEQSSNILQFEENASKFFKRFVSLTHLNVSGMAISKEVADNLAIAFDSNLCSLEHLIMNNCQLTSDNSINIIKKVRKCLKMRELQLSNNLIDNVATEELVVSILHLNEVELLTLENNCFNNTHQKVFHFLVNNLKFSECEIDFSGDVDGIIAFIILLECMTMVPVNESDFVNNISKIKNLSLDCSKQSSTHQRVEITPKASEFFRRFKLTKLNLSGIHITDKVINDLCEAFEAYSTPVEYLLINNCNLNSRLVEILLLKLHDLRFRPHVISLCNNLCDDSITNTLIIFAKHYPCTLINLEGNKLSEESKTLYMLWTKDCKYEEISFTNINYIRRLLKYFDNFGYSYVYEYEKCEMSQFIKNVMNAKELRLSIPRYSAVSLSFKASHVFYKFNNLTCLDISGIVIVQEAIDILGKAFSTNLQTLMKLSLDNCGLATKTFEYLLIQLKNAPNMTYLGWPRNEIGDEAIEEITTAILSWTHSLQHIDYSREYFSPECVLLLDVLMGNDNINSLDFSNNYYSIISFVATLNHVSDCTSYRFQGIIPNIKELSLDCTQLQEKVKLPFKAVAFLKNFTGLIKLNVNGITINEDITDTFTSVLKTSLQELNFLFKNNCQLTSEVAIKFIEDLHNKNIKKLQMCDNLIDDEATEAFAMAILKWKSPQVMLANNKFSKTSLLTFQKEFTANIIT